MSLDADFLARALAVAQRAADAAEALTLPRYRARDFSVETKADLTPVTEADRGAEVAIKAALRAAFPDHAFYGEEEGREGDGDFLWLIDPIDGTKSFVRGYPFFSTQIALDGFAANAVLSARNGDPGVQETLRHIGEPQPDGSSKLAIRGRMFKLY